MAKDDYPRIYLLPNLMTAGNLFCGFFAVLTIFKGMEEATFREAVPFYKQAMLLIFGACLFDLLDGRLARMGGKDSPFGREFDSIADIVSFGMAPALLVSQAVLVDFELPARFAEIEENVTWGVAFIYLLCGAMRLARFNCIAALPQEGRSHDFEGIPIPMAAGFIASLTFLIMWFPDDARPSAFWNYILVLMMLGVSLLMMSQLRYPSFKKVNLRTKANLPTLVILAICLAALVKFYWIAPAILFTAYLLFGLIRPLLSKKLQHEIDSVVDLDDDSDEENGGK